MQMSAQNASLGAGAATAEAFGERPVDLVHLARYTLGNRSLEREVLELFLTQSKLYLSRLKEAVSDKAWRDAAHTIKGSARGIGAWQVATSAEAAEALQGAALKKSRQRALADLDASVLQVNDYIRSLLTDG